MIGVDSSDPNTPPLVIVNVPPLQVLERERAVTRAPRERGRRARSPRASSARAANTGTSEALGRAHRTPTSSRASAPSPRPGPPRREDEQLQGTDGCLHEERRDPRSTPCALEGLLAAVASSIMVLIFTSLKVVSIAAACCASTRSRVIVGRRFDIRTRSSRRSPRRGAVRRGARAAGPRSRPGPRRRRALARKVSTSRLSARLPRPTARHVRGRHRAWAATSRAVGVTRSRAGDVRDAGSARRRARASEWSGQRRSQRPPPRRCGEQFADLDVLALRRAIRDEHARVPAPPRGRSSRTSSRRAARRPNPSPGSSTARDARLHHRLTDWGTTTRVDTDAPRQAPTAQQLCGRRRSECERLLDERPLVHGVERRRPFRRTGRARRPM